MTNEIDDRSAAPDKRQRIAKLMARAGLCSRREAEAWILSGRVSVNGEMLTSPARDVGADDAILVDGMALRAAEKTRLFLFHKPRGLVTSDRDPEGRATVFDYLRENWPEGPRVVSIGRLDINTEGLLLLTNDGGLARVLELPETGWVRRYRVRAKGTADPSALDALTTGITIDGIDYAGIEAKLDRVQGANCWLTVGLREGKNREVKRVLEHLGLEVNRLIRLSFGPFQLLDLPEGAVEEVRTRVLRDQLGPSLATKAGSSFEVGEPRTQENDTEPLRGTIPRRRVQQSDCREKPAGRKRVRRIDEPTPRRDRPVVRTRKHVSTLRTAERAAAKDGPRRRIERSDTQDRRARTVVVERRMAARPTGADAQQSRRPARYAGAANDRQEPRKEGAAHLGSKQPRNRDAQNASERGRKTRDERGQRRQSPSAEGKRQRVIRSGGSRSKSDSADARPDAPRRRSANKAKSRGDRRDRGDAVHSRDAAMARPPRSAKAGKSRKPPPRKR